MDNWTLQNVAEVLDEGFDPDTASEIEFMPDGVNYGYKDLSAAYVQLECLLQLLNNIVLADACYVDDQSIDTWQGRSEVLDSVFETGLVVGRSFDQDRETWVAVREAIVEQLCSCPGMKETHLENVRTFKAKQPQPDRMLGQLLWGGAGMLARSRYFGLPYVTHPLRERMLQKAGHYKREANAHQHLRQFVETQRMGMFRELAGNGFYASLRLPPIAMEVLNKAADVDEILPIAIQMREEFKELRQWLAEFQRALELDDRDNLEAKQNIFNSVARYLESRRSNAAFGETTLQVSVTDLPRVGTKPMVWLNAMQNKFGVRAQINRMMWTPAGVSVVRRLLGFFGQDQTTLAVSLEQELLRRNSVVA